MKLSYLWRGFPGHPLHPPLTDATIGAYTFAMFAALLDVTGLSNSTAAHGWWLALLFGLFTTVFTALAGLIDWLDIEAGTPLKRTATTHMITMLSATLFFGLAALFGHDDWKAGNVSTVEFVLTLVGFALLTLGGTFGGSITYVHGMRVLNLVDEPAKKALTPMPSDEKEQAEGS
jgi:uncharacterized membrane protein